MNDGLRHDATAQPVDAHPDVGLPAASVKRREQITRHDFENEFLSGPGQPVVITDAMEGWAARTKWTFSFFDREFGDKTVIVADRLGAAKAARRVRLSDYLTYCQFPFMTSLAQPAPEHPFYLTSFSPFSQHPELLEDFSEPYFVENIFQELTGELKNWYYDGFSWIFIGPRGTLSPFHVDLFGTHAWLAQLRGTKQFVLLPPPIDSHPELRIVECVLAPGEVIFIPAGWAHQVVSLEASISLTFNFVNRSNYLRHLLAISRDLPLWTKKIEMPAFVTANCNRWISRGFDVREERPEERTRAQMG